MWASGLSFSLSLLLFSRFKTKDLQDAQAGQNGLAKQRMSMTVLAPYTITSGVCVWITHTVPDQHSKELSQYVSWMILVTAIPVAMMTPKMLGPRLISLSTALMSIYILLCLSYEGLFLLCLIATLFAWVSISSSNSSLSIHDAKDNNAQAGHFRTKKIDPHYVSAALMYLLFALTSFFGTGNVASVNSFDPRSIQTLVRISAKSNNLEQRVNSLFNSFQVTTFNTYWMGALLMLKILIPILVVSVFAVGVQRLAKINLGSLFILVLLFCDIMGLHFFFLVTDSGSWLQIGTSLSHFIIIEAIAVFLQALFMISRVLVLGWNPANEILLPK